MSIKTVTPRQAKCIAALAAGLSLGEAAQAAGISVKTVGRWKTEDVFRSALRQETDVIMKTQTARLAHLTDLALAVLEEILSGNASVGVKRLAAVNVADLRLRYHDAADLEDRLAALEEKVYGQ